MTVSELIERLKTMSPDAMVVVRGYEDGVNEADHVAECNITPFFDNAWYYGLYEVSPNDGENAVFISSSRDNIKDDA
jgi:hypothetical protein